MTGVYPVRRHRTELRQSIRHDPETGTIGDCWRTSIACLLGYPNPETVPHFVAELPARDNPHYRDVRAARWWLRRFGVDLAVIEHRSIENGTVPFMATRTSPRGTHHSVIGIGRSWVWDVAGYDLGHYSPPEPDEPVELLVEPYAPGPADLYNEWETEPANG